MKFKEINQINIMKLTISLILINILVFFFSLPFLDLVIKNFGFSQENFFKGNYHTLLSSIFIHANLAHLLNNMIALFLLGSSLEKKLSKWKYLIVYILSGVCGNLSLLIPIFGYSKETVGIGASGAISGLIGLGTFICPGRLTLFPTIFPLPFILVGAIYFLSTSSLLFAKSVIGYPAHLLGMITGCFFGLIWGKNRVKRFLLFILTCVLIILLPFIIPLILR